MSDAVKGGLSSGGVGSCRIGRGGALEARGSVTPGMAGITGGKLRSKGLRLSFTALVGVEVAQLAK
jgi:hypothetical protein